MTTGQSSEFAPHDPVDSRRGSQENRRENTWTTSPWRTARLGAGYDTLVDG